MGDNPHIPEEERRQYKRIKKNFIMNYFDPDNPDEKIEITQLKNISKGGMCFITTHSYDNNTRLGVELKTPYITDLTYLEGAVLESIPKANGMLYETRLQFGNLNPQAEFVINKLMEVFVHGGLTEND